MSTQAGPAERALRAAVESSCAIRVSQDAAAAFLSNELDHWLDPSVPPDELDGLVLARLVTHEVRWVGKHFLPLDRLERLAAIRDRYAGHDPYLDAFLDCILDKHEGRYWNRTYLSLPVLEVLLAEHDLPPSGVAALLAADIARYELCAAHRRTDVSPVGRPEPRTLRTRLRHAHRFMTAHLGGASSEGLLAAIAHEPESDLPHLLLQLPTPPSTSSVEWLELSVQPVSTVHDEYFFMRVLQAHEMAFTGMARRMRDATAAIRDQQLGQATGLLEEVVAFMDRNASLFRMVATMRYEAFHTFREFTDGASAIQSEQYKRFEGLCGLPPTERLDSPAFESVPGGRRGGQRRTGHDDRRLPRRVLGRSDRRTSSDHRHAAAHAGGEPPALEVHPRHHGDPDARRSPGVRLHGGRRLPQSVGRPPACSGRSPSSVLRCLRSGSQRLAISLKLGVSFSEVIAS